MNYKKFFFCPIPDSQKPIQNYISIKQKLLNQLKFRTIFFSLSFFLTISTLTKISTSSLFFKFLLILINIPFIIYLIGFLKCKEMESRFKESRIFYEESSWFDGQFWEKSFLIIKNDNLLKTQEIYLITRMYLKKLRLLFFLSIPLIVYFVN